MKRPDGSAVKAVALVSSGLDSMLAARIVKDFGVDVLGVFFLHRFDCPDVDGKRRELENAYAALSIPIRIIDLSEPLLKILRHPEHGYGTGVNPCIDCHILMLKEAHRVMIEIGGQFLVSGEVVGQRPMSQMKPTLFHIDKVSGLKELILRPLSAKILPVTLPEKKGWVDRGRLFDISGRSRRAQLRLAEAWGIKGFHGPAGGCVLTEPNYARRVTAFIARRGEEALTVETLCLFRYGRHFWPADHLHVVVGRDARDNEALEAFASGRWIFRPADTEKGPLVLAEGITEKAEIELAASIAARYTTEKEAGRVRIKYIKDKTGGSVLSEPADENRLVTWRV